MGKRGQFTLFVILGIIVLILAGLLIYFRTDLFFYVGLSDGLSNPSEVNEIRSEIAECFETLALDSIYYVSANGGYYGLPGDSFYYSYLSVPYYLYGGEIDYPSKEEIEEEIIYYFDQQYEFCLFYDDLSLEEVNIDVQIEDNLINYLVDLPLTYNLSDAIYDLESDYDYTFDLNLNGLYENSIKIAENHLDSPFVDVTFLGSLDSNEILYSLFENDTLVYMLVDNSSEDLSFKFALQVNYTAQEEELFYDLLEGL
jgi:hypothetical protein